MHWARRSVPKICWEISSHSLLFLSIHSSAGSVGRLDSSLDPDPNNTDFDPKLSHQVSHPSIPHFLCGAQSALLQCTPPSRQHISLRQGKQIPSNICCLVALYLVGVAKFSQGFLMHQRIFGCWLRVRTRIFRGRISSWAGERVESAQLSAVQNWRHACLRGDSFLESPALLLSFESVLDAIFTQNDGWKKELWLRNFEGPSWPNHKSAVYSTVQQGPHNEPKH